MISFDELEVMDAPSEDSLWKGVLGGIGVIGIVAVIAT
ncbi:MpaA1 family daptide-type RiPP [Rathayibacter rathayi]